MANIQIGNSSGVVPVKKNFLKDLGNVALSIPASLAEGITGKKFFDPKMTTGLGKTLGGAVDIIGQTAGALAPAALNIVAPGAGTALSTVGQGIGKALPGDSVVETGIGSGLASLVSSNPDMAGKIKGMFRKGGYLNYKRSITNHYAKGGTILPDFLHMDRETYNKYALGGSLEMSSPEKTPTANLVDTTGFADQSRTILYNSVKMSPDGFIGNKRNKDMAQYSSAMLNTLGATGDGTPTPWYTKSTPEGIMMQPLGDKNTQVNLGHNKALAKYISTIGVTEFNKLRNPMAYEAAKKEFAKRVNIAPVNTEHAMGGELTRYNGPKHENGGIPISQTDEVEGGETSFKSPKDGTFIFSDSIPVPNKNKTFAQESKSIDNKYAKRTGDVWSDNSKKMELAKLAELQEQVKAASSNDTTIAPNGSIHKMGGMIPMTKVNGRSRYNLSKKLMNLHRFGDPIEETPTSDKVLSLDPDRGVGGLSITPMKMVTPSIITSNTKPSTLTSNTKDSDISKPYKTNNTIPMAGYAAQALTNVPMLLSKPSKVKYDRITPEKIDLTAQRLEAQGIRDKSLAVSRRNASMLGSASAVNAYTGAVTSDVYGKYGDTYNNSLMNEKATNAQIGNNAKAQNAQIQMAEVEANQREQDAVRSAKQQALFNIGQSIAGAGKASQDAKQQDAMMNWLNMSNSDYGGKYVNGVYVPYRKKTPTTNKYGGKLKGGKK